MSTFFGDGQNRPTRRLPAADRTADPARPSPPWPPNAVPVVPPTSRPAPPPVDPARPGPPGRPGAPEPRFPEQPSAPAPGSRWRRAGRTSVRWGLRLLAVFVVFCVTAPAVYRVATPPRTLFMLTDEADGPTVFQNVSLDYISRHYVAAALVHEDAKLGTRTGPYHVGEFVDRTQTYITTGDDLSGSTIPQQLVKNIFLIRGEWALAKIARKGVEAVLAWPFNMMGDRRQLELYLNYAQFGPNLYGICAASWYYFNRPPWDGNAWYAATLAGLLPLGEDGRRAAGGGVDITSDGTWVAASTVTRARERVPMRISEMGGWEGTVATVGIRDSAEDNNPLDDPDSCSAMPRNVADRLEAEGAWWSAEYGG